jgi:DNA-binding CsgD family transcriptional regulator
MHLTTADLRLLLDLVELLRKPSLLSLIDRPDAVQKLASLIHADFVGHALWNCHAGRFEEATHWGRDVQMAVDYERHYQFIDPISPLQCGRRDPIPSDTVVDRRTFIKTEYFGDFMSRYKAYSGIDLYLHDAGQIQFDYRFWTSDRKKRFGAREISLLNVLRPHLINEYHLRLVERSRSQPDTSTGSCPGFLLQESRSPKPNHKARKLLAGLNRGDRDTLYRLLSQIRHGSSPALQWNGFNLCVEHVAHADSGRPVYAVNLLAHTIGSGAWLQQRFDLTLREGEICHLLLKGMADKQIAAMLNISYWTVRIHVGRVLEKLAIDSRSAIGLAVLNASHNASIS